MSAPIEGFENVTKDGVEYYWRDWQRWIDSDFLTGTWSSMRDGGVFKASAIADLKASDTLKAQRKENAFNSLVETMKEPHSATEGW